MNPLVVVMGVSGSGKSSVARPLADRLGVEFGEGDELHSQHNLDKMAAGEPLDDADREPWLEAVGGWLAEHEETGGVMTCSALKRSYRDLLRSAAPSAVFLHLVGDRELLTQRMGERGDRHFMPTSMLESQLATLEPLGPDEAGVAEDIRQPIGEIISSFLRWADIS